MVKLDRKFDGVIFKVKDGSIVPPDQYIVFLAKDDAFLPTLRFYRAQCQQCGADDNQLQAVDEAIRRVEAWREANPALCKTPDVAAKELLK